MKTWSRTKKTLIGIIIFLLLIQAIRPAKNNGNPAGPKDINTVVQVPDSVMTVLKRSCYDCHSNYTTYPWYDQVTPVNWWVANHINDGKKHFNFTIFGEYTPQKMDKKLKEVSQTVEENEMPLNSYLWVHKDAKLTEAEKRQIIDWATSAREKLPK